MNVWEGKSVFGGIAIGPVALFEKEEDLVKLLCNALKSPKGYGKETF